MAPDQVMESVGYQQVYRAQKKGSNTAARQKKKYPDLEQMLVMDFTSRRDALARICVGRKCQINSAIVTEQGIWAGALSSL